MVQHHSNKAPLQTIIGIFQINLYHHIPIIPFPLFKKVDKFLGNYKIVRTLLPAKKATCIGDIKEGSKGLNLCTNILSQSYILCYRD